MASPNPSGRPKGEKGRLRSLAARLQQRMAEDGFDPYDFLVGTIKGVDVYTPDGEPFKPPLFADRIAALKLLLGYSHGTPISSAEVEEQVGRVLASTPALEQLGVAVLEDLSDRAAEELEARLLASLEAEG